MTIILVILLMLVFVGGIGALLFFMVKKLDPMRDDKSENSNLAIAQDFLPFDDIRNGMIILPNHCYRAILDCSALNFDLKTEGERDQIELSFQQFINSLNFPISIFLQTKEIDNSRRIELLKKDIEKTLIEFPGMKVYADHFLADMQNLNAKIGNNQQKKRYIVVTYDEAIKLENLTDGEKAAYARKELLNRCNSIRNGLDSVGIISHVMTTAELIELAVTTGRASVIPRPSPTTRRFPCSWTAWRINSATCPAPAGSTWFWARALTGSGRRTSTAIRTARVPLRSWSS